MPDKNLQNNNLACEQWEAMLADALDGLLAGEEAARFDSHAHSCEACVQLLDEARRGQQWLRYLSKEPAVPQDLVARILAQTTGSAAVAAAVPNSAVAVMPKQSGWKHIPFFAGLRRTVEPRLMMTAAMAFFSIALTLNLMGIRAGNVHLSDLNPMLLRSNLERQLANASRPVVRYYDSLRWVYELQARVQEFRRSGQEEDSGQRKQEQQQQQQQPPANHGGSAKKNGVSGKDGGSFNDPQRIAPPAPVIAGHMMEAKLEWKTGDKKPIPVKRVFFVGRRSGQAERSLA